MQTELDLFTILPEDKKPEAGKILISEPFLPDIFFNRSIVYLTEHTAKGAVGFILNKELDVKISDIVDGLEGWDETLNLGGPVATDTLHYLHSLDKIIPNSIEIKDNIYWGGDIDALKKTIKAGKAKSNQIRFFLGYSGWSAGQLENELKENSWVIASAKQDIVMTNYGDDTWKHVLRSLNTKYSAWADFPESPDMN